MWFYEDIQAARQRDPAARHALEVLLCYPGLHALWMHRLNHRLWHWGFRLAARLLAHLTRLLTGVEIHPAARIGRRLFIDHGMGVVIGETAVIGDDVTLYQQVTLGGNRFSGDKRHPTLEQGVTVGASAVILGDITIGQNAQIGAGSVITKSVPPGSTVVGVPGRPIHTPSPSAPNPNSGSPP